MFLLHICILYKPIAVSPPNTFISKRKRFKHIDDIWCRHKCGVQIIHELGRIILVLAARYRSLSVIIVYFLWEVEVQPWQWQERVSVAGVRSLCVRHSHHIEVRNCFTSRLTKGLLDPCAVGRRGSLHGLSSRKEVNRPWSMTVSRPGTMCKVSDHAALVDPPPL